MNADPIIDEIRQYRQEYARRFDFDPQRILEDLMRLAAQHKERMVSYPPRPARKRKTA